MKRGRKQKIGQDVGSFLRQYGRRKHAGHDPNDRGYDRELEAKLKRLPPEELDLLIRGELGWNSRVEGVCLLVRVGAISRHASVRDRLRSTGFTAQSEDVTADTLADYLGNHPDLVEEWLRYS